MADLTREERFTPEERQKLAQAVSDGQRMKVLVEDPVFVRAQETLRKRLFDEWKAAPSPVVREECWLKQHALDELVRELRIVIGSGELAGHTLEVEERRRTS